MAQNVFHIPAGGVEINEKFARATLESHKKKWKPIFRSVYAHAYPSGFENRFEKSYIRNVPRFRSLNAS
jgi:hypothetical protein